MTLIIVAVLIAACLFGGALLGGRGSQLIEERRNRVAHALILSGCFVVGLTTWSLFIVGRNGDGTIEAAWWLCALAAVALIGAVFEGSALAIAGATFAGPFFAAGSTTPRGDNDGLWALVFPIIVFVAAFGCLVVVVVRRMVPTTRLRGATRRLVAAHLRVAAAVVLVAGIASLVFLVERRHDPYPALDRLVSDFPAPRSFEPGTTRRGGDPLCTSGCEAFVELSFSPSEPPRAVCKTAEAALGAWTPTGVTSSEPIFDPQSDYREVCSWIIQTAEITGSMAVSDEPEGTVVRLTVVDTWGRRTQ